MSGQSYAYNLNTVEKEQLKPVVKTHKKRKIKATPRILGSIVMFFAVALVFSVVLRYTMINEMASKNRMLEKQLNNLIAANEQTSVYLDRTTNLNNVEIVATNDLAMQLPDNGQVVEVSLEMNNKAVTVNDKKLGVFKKLGGFFNGALEYLY